MNRETLGAYAAGLIAKGWTPTRDDLAEFAQADVESPHDAFEIGQLDAITKAARWVLESNLAKLGYVRIPGEAKAKSGKGGNLVLARKGSELRDKAEKLGLNKKADAKGEHGNPIASMTEREVRDELKLVQSKISFITRSMPVGQMTPTDPEGWNALHKRQHELHKMLAEHTRDADNAKVAAEELRRKEYNDANEKRKMALPTKQTRNGWDIATDGARWFLRDPATKEIVYDGTLKRVREVADESPPDVPEKLAPKPDGEAKVDSGDESLWSITVEQAGRNAMSKARAEDIAKLEEMKSLAKQGHYSVVGKFAPYKTKKDALADIAKKREALDNPTRRDLMQYAESAGDDGRSHYSHVRRALEAGKPVPAEVLADYPDLVKKYGNGANL